MTSATCACKSSRAVDGNRSSQAILLRKFSKTVTDVRWQSVGIKVPHWPTRQQDILKTPPGIQCQLGTYSSNNMQYVQLGSLIKFRSPTGYYFDANNRLVLGTPTRADEKLTIWASATAVYLDGTNQGRGNFANGSRSSCAQQLCSNKCTMC